MYYRLCNPLLSKSFFLFGSRATGKSTLLLHLFQGKSTMWIDLLDEDTCRELSDRPQLLQERIAALKAPPSWVVIDEVQKVPELLDVVHKLIVNQKQKFALTGSSARKLKRGGANLLAGRALVYQLYPLTFEELGDDFELFKALQLGTLPEVVTASSLAEAQQTLKAYVNTYLREEVLIEQLVRNIVPFRKFLEIAAQSNGQILNFSKIGRDCGVDSSAIDRYFQILEDTYIGFRLQPYDRSIRKRQSQKPKFYFFDLGVRRTLEGLVTIPVVEGNFQFGKLFEHLVILEIIRLNEYYQTDFRFSYLMTKDNAEIDLIVERPAKPPVAIEIKSSTLVDESEINKLSRLGGDIRSAKLMILCRESSPRVYNGVRILHWQQGIRELFESL